MWQLLIYRNGKWGVFDVFDSLRSAVKQITLFEGGPPAGIHLELFVEVSAPTDPSFEHFEFSGRSGSYVIKKTIQ